MSLMNKYINKEALDNNFKVENVLLTTWSCYTPIAPYSQIVFSDLRIEVSLI